MDNLITEYHLIIFIAIDYCIHILIYEKQTSTHIDI